MRQSRFQDGVEKNIAFRDPFFSILADFGCPGGSKKIALCPFFGSFPILGAIFLLGRHFGSFWWILVLSEPSVNDFRRISWH